jgi:phosphonopyruvate decarboxylase
MAATGLSYAFVMREGSVAPHALESARPSAAGPATDPSLPPWTSARPARLEVLRLLQEQCRPADALIATTGFMGRALYAVGDRENQLYLVGSMGCASSVALGLALAQPARRVLVIDGDGAALMRLGALATIGHLRPRNLVHVLLDNERHESTGGQATVADTTDLALVAHACGYSAVHRAPTLGDLEHILRTTGDELAFVHVKIRPDEAVKLPRPTETPEQVARRFRQWLQATADQPSKGRR